MTDDAKPRPGRGRKPSGLSEREAAVQRARARKLELKRGSGEVDLADKIRLLMAARGLTQSSLARIVKDLYDANEVTALVHQSRLSKWLLLSGEPNHAQTHAIAAALRVPMMYLVDPTRVDPPNLRELELVCGAK